MGPGRRRAHPTRDTITFLEMDSTHRHNPQTRAGCVVGSVTLERVNGYPCGVGREWGCLFANILSALSLSAGLASLGPPLLYHR